MGDADDRTAAAVAATRPARKHRARPEWRWRVSGSRLQILWPLSCHDPDNHVGQRTDANTQCQHGNRAEGDKADAGYRVSHWRFPRPLITASMCDTPQPRHSKTYKSGKSSNRDVIRARRMI